MQDDRKPSIAGPHPPMMKGRHLAREGVPDGAAESLAAFASTIATVRRVYLFGSRIKREATPASDLDVAFEMDGINEGERTANYMLDVAARPEWALLEQRFGIRLGHIDLEPVGAAVADHARLIYSAGASGRTSNGCAD